ncbi:hydrogenase expression/formation C-terminal domain-containing protein [Thiohalomonas denitrificans]|uniref:Hydrogenase-1 operon protein HyaF n=1 Tax=Thiohalomonas denitrificans TaxID=415747 RepID=A0A1G5PM05_9GAMM|nr:hydrogenase expression/formation C-terminal domain-containing protein [Thiohalomonas denitrificans]SCZ50241.1 hydrogenase-1 operon protein HyaF [Thiohalomonas denitrificans]
MDDVRTRIEHTANVRAEGGHARAILLELEQMLRDLLEKGEESSIDLGSLPLTDADYELLNEALGEGEVMAEVEGVGLTHIRESGIPGVWFVTHLNEEDEVMAQFIEVAYSPEILSAPMEEVKAGLDGLRARSFATRGR